MKRLLVLLAFGNFASALFARMTDPLVPPIASEMNVDPVTVALLGSAFALPWAIVQPILGPLGDLVGKVRVMTACLSILVVSAIIGALATNFSVLLIARIISGAAAGGISPVSMAYVSDLVPVGQRQVAMGRLIMAGVLGQLLGGVLAGVLADFVGWRGIFVLGGVIAVAATIGTAMILRTSTDTPPQRLRIVTIVSNYQQVLANPLTKICYLAVFVEGIALFGVLPFLAVLLLATGEPRASIAGVVVSGFAVGSMIYALSVDWLVRRFTPRTLMIMGGIVSALGLLLEAAAPPWPLQFVAMTIMGCGFFLLHGVLMVQMSELAPGARGTAVAGHAFSFYVGQALGPMLFGVGFALIGASVTLVIASLVMAVTGAVVATLLHRRSGAV
jgi:predicted MFS family arabinose efflux permease